MLAWKTDEKIEGERQKATRNTFNLEDEDELTHFGQSLSAMDDFDNTGLGLEDEDEDEGVSSRDIRHPSSFL